MNHLTKNADKQPKKSSAQLIGVGLDQIDGHKRITQAERFAIVGGSQETHERMTETVIKTFETLDRRGENLDQVDPHQLKDIIQDNTPK